MVQERDAAIKRVEARKASLKKIHDEFERSILQTIYVVMELTPGYEGWGMDRDTPDKSLQVSPGFKTKAAAEKWMDAHEPDPGKRLWIGKKHLRKIEYTEWTGVYKA